MFNQKEYLKKYFKINKDKFYAAKRRYRLAHKDEIKKQSKQYYDLNKKQISERNKIWYLKNKELILKKQREYHKNNKEKIHQTKREHYLKHKNEIKKRHEVYNRTHKKEIRIQKSIYTKNRRKIDVNYKMRTVLSNRINSTLKNNFKSQSTIKLLDCSIDQLKQYLEKQFKQGMKWSNWGTGYGNKGMKQWHIDHKIPCASFDLSKPAEQKKCFHYTNLQPLWAEENRRKKDKIIHD
jgi:hypothetical protein